MSADVRRIGVSPRMSQCVVHAGTAYLAGQVALDAIGQDVVIQTRHVLAQVDTMLAEAGSGRDRILSATIWLTDLTDFAAMNAEWDAWLPEGCAPARATVGAALALPGLSVEIAVVAAVD